jgi:hypothetical protein
MRIVFLLLLFGVSFTGVAQEASDETEAPATDEVFEYTQEESGEEEEVFVQKIEPDQVRSVSDYKKEKIFHRAFDENQRRKIIGDKDYSETHQEPEPEEETTPDEIPVPRGIWDFEWLKIVAYAVIAGIVLLIVFLVVQNLRIPKKIKQASTGGFKAESIEDIQELDIDTMLSKAMADADYKLAIRLYYLMLLRNLQNAGLIKWEKDKTNRDYINELHNSTSYYADVRRLTRSYEEVWYGEHVIPEPTLLTVISSFKAINGKLNPEKNL